MEVVDCSEWLIYFWHIAPDVAGLAAGAAVVHSLDPGNENVAATWLRL